MIRGIPIITGTDLPCISATTGAGEICTGAILTIPITILTTVTGMDIITGTGMDITSAEVMITTAMEAVPIITVTDPHAAGIIHRNTCSAKMNFRVTQPKCNRITLKEPNRQLPIISANQGEHQLWAEIMCPIDPHRTH